MSVCEGALPFKVAGRQTECAISSDNLHCGHARKKINHWVLYGILRSTICDSCWNTHTLTHALIWTDSMPNSFWALSSPPHSGHFCTKTCNKYFLTNFGQLCLFAKWKINFQSSFVKFEEKVNKKFVKKL